MDNAVVIPVAFVCGILYVIYKRFHGLSLRNVPGPDPESFWLGANMLILMSSLLFTEALSLVGNLRQIFHSPVGEIDTRWQEQYGGVVRIKGSFGVSFYLSLLLQRAHSRDAG